jgi:solute carrier family 13 (sodium-dependent dicarboxylate transporter), member 2/3/5
LAAATPLTRLERSDRNKKILALLGAAAVLCTMNKLPLDRLSVGFADPVALSGAGQASLGILAFVIVLWISEALPFAVAALTGLLMVPLFGLASFSDTVSYGFGNSVIVFFIGVLIISSGLTRSGLADRLTALILSRVGLQPHKLVFTFLAAGAALSMWIVNMSVSAILLPIGLNILRKAGAPPLRSNFGRALMIAIAWGPAIGGVATPVGNGANIVALGYLRELAGIQIDFLRWMMVGVPAMILILPLAYLVLIRVFPPEKLSLPEGVRLTETASGNKLNGTEMKAILIFAAAVLFWVGDPLLLHLTGLSIPIEAVALSAAILFFLPGINILSWKEAQLDIDWGGIVLIAAGLSLGMVIFQTGAARWLAVLAFSPVGGLGLALRIFAAVLAVELLKVFFSSNTVTGVILVPLVIALAADLNLDPWLLAGPVAVATSLAFLLVTSSPTNVIPYASGYFSIKDFARAGIPLTLLVPFCITLAFILFGRFIG